MELVVAFDIGDKRVGVAFSDPFGTYAMPSDTYFRTGNFREDVAAVAAIAKQRGATRIVCGLPLAEDGSESVQSEKTRKFGAALEKEAGVPVEWQDERYTTRAARSDLGRIGVSSKQDKKKKRVDSLAAAYILEYYLSEKRSNAMKEERNDYDDDNIVEIVDEEGNTYRYEHLMTFEYQGEWYCAFTPASEPAEAADDGEDDDEAEDVVIFRIAGSEDDETLEPVEDEALLDEVFKEFMTRYDEEAEDSEDPE